MEQKYSWMRTFLERFFFANAPIYLSTFLLRPDLLGKLPILIKNFHWQRFLRLKLSFQCKLDKIFVCTHSEHTLTLHCITGPGKQELHLTPGVTGSWLEQSFRFSAGQPHVSRWSFNQLWLSGLHQTTLLFSVGLQKFFSLAALRFGWVCSLLTSAASHFLCMNCKFSEGCCKSFLPEPLLPAAQHTPKASLP